MTVTLSKEAAQYVLSLVEAGAFATPHEAVDVLLRKHADFEAIRNVAAVSEAELEVALLKAVRGLREPWRGREEIEDIWARVTAQAKPYPQFLPGARGEKLS